MNLFLQKKDKEQDQSIVHKEWTLVGETDK